VETFVCLWQYFAEFFLKWEMFEIKFVNKIDTYFVPSDVSLKSCRLWDNVEKYDIPRKVTDNNTIWHMRFACRVTKTTHARAQTHYLYLCLPLRIGNTYCFPTAKTISLKVTQCYVTSKMPPLFNIRLYRKKTNQLQVIPHIKSVGIRAHFCSHEVPTFLKLEFWKCSKFTSILLFKDTRWFKYDRDYLCVNKSQFVPVIFEPPCACAALHCNLRKLTIPSRIIPSA
jgi:hypothetical protein